MQTSGARFFRLAARAVVSLLLVALLGVVVALISGSTFGVGWAELGMGLALVSLFFIVLTRLDSRTSKNGLA